MKEQRRRFCPKDKHRSKSKETFYDPIYKNSLYKKTISELQHKAWHLGGTLSLSLRENALSMKNVPVGKPNLISRLLQPFRRVFSPEPGPSADDKA